MGEAASRGPVASVILASACSLWSTLHTVTIAASGRLGQALVMRQSTVAFERISCPMCSRSSLLESVHYFFVSLLLAVLVPGVWVLLLSSKIGFFGRRLSSWVQCLVQQWIHVLRQYSGGFGRLYIFSTWWQTRFLKRHFSIRFEWRSVPSRCFGCCLALRSSHLETLDFFLRVSWAELHDDGWFFRRSVRPFFGLLFGVEAVPIRLWCCGHTHSHRVVRNNTQQQQQYNLGRLRFYRRGAFTSLWGAQVCSPLGRRP